jgi:uncharacterized protein YggT (Ycf19 family)
VSLRLLAELVNFALALLFWLIIGRWVLRLLVGQRENFFTELFRRGTDPAFRLVRRLLPSLVPDRYIPLWTLLLVALARLALLPLLLLDGAGAAR